MAVFSRTNTTTHYWSTWGGSSWSSASTVATYPDEALWVRVANCPTRNDIAIAILDYSNDVRLWFRSSGSFTSSSVVENNVGNNMYRAFDLAYEQSSGDLLIAYWDDTNSRIGFRTSSGTTASSESGLTLPSTAKVHWVTLTPRPSSDQVLLLALNSDRVLYASIWSGTAWGTVTTLTTDATQNDKECFGSTFERTSGDGLVVYGRMNSNQSRFRTLTGTTWSSEQTMAAHGNEADWIQMASKPGSNEIMLALMADTGSEGSIRANVWNGSAWGTFLTATSDCGDNDYRCFDIAYEPGGSNGILIYGTDSSTLHYRTWNGTNWSSQTSARDIGDRPLFVELQPAVSGSTIVLLCSDDDGETHGFGWTGSGWTSASLVNTPTGGEFKTQPFSIADMPNASARPRIRTWSQVEPD